MLINLQISLTTNFFFFKQKTAYDIHRLLEFRRVLIRSAPRWRPTASISSIKIMQGACFLACSNMSRTREAPTPTNISTKSEPEIVKNEIGRASCRERVEKLGVDVWSKKKRHKRKTGKNITNRQHNQATPNYSSAGETGNQMHGSQWRCSSRSKSIAWAIWLYLHGYANAEDGWLWCVTGA